MKGWSKNRKGQPYIVSEELRDLLFPQAKDVAVVFPSGNLPLVPSMSGLALEEHMSDLSDISETQEKVLLSQSEDDLPGHGSDPSQGSPGQPTPLPPIIPSSDLTQQKSTTSAQVPASQAYVTVDALSLAIAKALKEQEYKLEKKFKKEISKKSKKKSSKELPPASILPDPTAHNPWRVATHMQLAEGILCTGVPSLGDRPVGDFEFFPKKEDYPYCYVRLRPGLPMKDDIIPKEVVIMDFTSFQAAVVKEAKLAGAVNTQIPAFSRREAMFKAGPNVTFPFALKVIKATLDAVSKDKLTPPALEECKRPSLLLPANADIFDELEGTFIHKKLEPNCAAAQLNEKLPNIPDHLLRREWETRDRVSISLSHQSLLETMIFNRPNDKIFPILAKDHLQSLQYDIWAFAKARRTCRSYVLSGMSVRHEPQELINSAPWGEGLFPAALIRAIRDRAKTEGRSLLDRWGYVAPKTHKRKASPSPKKQGFKIPKKDVSHKRPPQPHYSAATIPAYENPGPSFRRPPSRRGDSRSRARFPRNRGTRRGTQ